MERIGKPTTDGLLVGTCHVFPKIDGTNASIWKNKNGELEFGSRNRKLSLEKDNAGFMRIMLDNKLEVLHAFFNKYPNYRLYGEFLVKHTIKYYHDDAWRKFYVFDVLDENGEYIPYEKYIPMLNEFCLDYIPIIEKVENPTVETLIELARSSHFLIPKDKVGEGIVVKNYDFINKFGEIVWGKIVLEEFLKTKKSTHATKALAGEYQVEAQIVDEFFTESFIAKEQAKILNIKQTEWLDKYTVELLGRTWREFVNEEMFNIVKKYRNPVINFKKLNQMTIAATKEFLNL